MKAASNNLVVLGGGESGTGAAILGRLKGWEVFVSDNGKIQNEYKKLLSSHDIKWEESQHSRELLSKADLVVKSPGIRDDIPILNYMKELGIPIISEIEFAFKYTKAKIIAITGSNGKTTTSMLIFHILKRADFDVCLAGNIGNSFSSELVKKDHKYFILELSSFQLDGIVNFQPHVSILLNITPDHLNRYYNQIEKYAESKMRITFNQLENDYFIYCADDKIIQKEIANKKPRAISLAFSIFKQTGKGGYLKYPFANPLERINIQEGNEMIVKLNKQIFKMAIHQLALKGKHNLYNGMASTIAARIFEIDDEIIRDSLMDFQNVEHRLEFVTTENGVSFINDSKATNVNSVWYALESTPAPIIWIAGGEDKGNDYNLLKQLVKEKVKAIICLGIDNSKLRKAFEKNVPEFIETDSMLKAVLATKSISTKGDSVLLSPACASFDLFNNYEDRGRQFKEVVRSL